MKSYANIPHVVVRLYPEVIDQGLCSNIMTISMGIGKHIVIARRFTFIMRIRPKRRHPYIETASCSILGTHGQQPVKTISVLVKFEH